MFRKLWSAKYIQKQHQYLHPLCQRQFFKSLFNKNSTNEQEKVVEQSPHKNSVEEGKQSQLIQS